MASFVTMAATGTGGPAMASTPAAGVTVPFGSAAQQQLALLGDAAESAAGGPVTGTTASSNLPRELVVPDVLAVIPTGIPSADVSRIRKLAGVRSVLTVSGGAIMIGGKPANVLGVTPQQFRAWTPPSAAGDQGLWQALGHGSFIATSAAKGRLASRRVAPTRSPRPAAPSFRSAGRRTSPSPAWTPWSVTRSRPSSAWSRTSAS